MESVRRHTASLTGGLAARPVLSLVVITLVTGAVGYWGSSIPIRSDLEALFPDDTPAVVRARTAREVLGSRKELQVLLGGAGKETNREAARALGERLGKHTDLLNKVEVRRDIAFFEDQALLYLPVEDLQRVLEEVSEGIREAVRQDMALDDDFALDDDPPKAPADKQETRLPSVEELKTRYRADGLSEYFESPDGQVIAVKAYPNFKPTDPDRTRQLTERVQGDIDAIMETYSKAGLSATVEGDYAQVTQAVNQIRDDLGRSSAVALIVVVILLTAAFRRLRAVLLVVVPLVVGLAWTLALARMAVGSLNLITAFIFAILVGLGIDFAVHAVSRVDEEVRGGRPLVEGITHALTGLGRAMVAAVGTTMATFGALTVFDFRGFSQFGLIAALGVGVCLVAVYTVLPPLAVGLDRLRSRPGGADVSASGVSARDHRRAPALWVLATLSLLTLIAAMGLPRVEFEGDMGKLRTRAAKEASELRKKYRKEAEQRTASPALILTDGLEATQRVHRHLEGELDNIELLDDVASIYSFVPGEQDAKLKLVKEIKRKIDMKYGLLEGQAKADADQLRPYLSPSAFGVEALPDWVRERFTDTSGRLGRYVLLYPRGRKSDARQVQRIQDAIGEVTVDGETYHSTAT
ncbi:MAG: MMPL family transporter, partial [Myxococcota bacterium]|nr:MMPL family transporter [Myxococcota bacterium]